MANARTEGTKSFEYETWSFKVGMVHDPGREMDSCNHDNAMTLLFPRALRRDDDSTREICITISCWRVVQQKLIPLVLECRDDGPLVKTIFKIYVMLTMPLSKPARDALTNPINPKAEGDVRDKQTRRRENAMAQQVCLRSLEYPLSLITLLFRNDGSQLTSERFQC